MSGVVDGTVVWLTIRQLFARKRLVASVLFSLAPAIIAALFRAGHGAADPGAPAFLITVFREIVIGTLLPLAAAVLGTSAFGSEVDDGTVVYLLVRPLARWRVVMSKYVVAVGATFAIMLPALLLPWIIVGVGTVPFSQVIGFGAGALAGSAVYCALFVMLGLTSRRSLVVALLYIVVVEESLSRNIVGLKSISVREFAVAVSKAAGVGDSLGGAVSVSMATVWTMGTIILVGALLLAVRRLSRYETAEKL
ncbi:MAG: ABC transporter permease [Candidatus Eremiobacteraeota bacterium]|nr:ABC transporter permease [Candidatus Eremiobacteraeota bacterium]